MADDGNQQRKHDFRRPAVFFAIGVVVTLVLAAGVVIALLRTGDAQAVSDNAPLIAAVIALGGVGTAQMVSIALEGQRTQEARELEDKRTQEARDLETQRAREAALQNYFENVGELLIEKPLRRASPGDNLSTVVRAQTLSVLEGLDPERKRILLLFLYESGLIYSYKLVVSLEAANLRDVNLRDVNLNLVNLQGAYLQEANLRGANLERAYLERANLRGAKLQDANLQEANLQEANLREAKLQDAKLQGANLQEASLLLANLEGAKLQDANLQGASLQEASLQEANLHGATVTDEQLADAQSLQGAIMPDGQTYEDWRKDKEGSGKDVENG